MIQLGKQQEWSDAETCYLSWFPLVRIFQGYALEGKFSFIFIAIILCHILHWEFFERLYRTASILDTGIAVQSWYLWRPFSCVEMLRFRKYVVLTGGWEPRLRKWLRKVIHIVCQQPFWISVSEVRLYLLLVGFYPFFQCLLSGNVQFNNFRPQPVKKWLNLVDIDNLCSSRQHLISTFHFILTFSELILRRCQQSKSNDSKIKLLAAELIFVNIQYEKLREQNWYHVFEARANDVDTQRSRFIRTSIKLFEECFRLRPTLPKKKGQYANCTEILEYEKN